jgi:putative DNA primase/helicase
MTNYESVLTQIRQAGLMVDTLAPDGKVHRCTVEGSRERKGWYLLHVWRASNGAEYVVGSFGVWQGTSNNTIKVEMSRDVVTTDADRAALKARLEEDRKKAKAQRGVEAARAAQRASGAWAKALTLLPSGKEADYLLRKGVKSHGLRYTESGALVVPMMDASGDVKGLQFILPKDHPRAKSTGRDKEYWPKGLSKAGRWFQLGKPVAGSVVLVAEGYATAASLFEATGRPVAVAFDAGNLSLVARALQKAHRVERILVCADDDYLQKCLACGKASPVAEPVCGYCGKAHGQSNPGAQAAAAAALAVGGAWLAPVFPGDRAGKKLTDFNDLQNFPGGGLELVKRQVESKISEHGWTTQMESHSSPEKSFDPFSVDNAGVWFSGFDRDGRPLEPEWVCSRLEVESLTRNTEGADWGYLLKFADPMNHPKTWAMPARMLSGDGNEMRSMLLGMGLRIAPSPRARLKLTEYIQTRTPGSMALCVDRVGWHGFAYVLPTETIGDDAEKVVYQTDGPSENNFRQRGTVDQWVMQVGKLCSGNSRAVFAVACAFTGPILRAAGMESGGLHFRGDSSSGKTTVLRVAASVWGAPNYLQRWRATDNALEVIASQHCDGLLILDELAQVDPKVSGETAYLLANETAKARATRTGGARARKTWRLLFISAGEVSLADHMSEGGKRVRAGQEARMADIPADAGKGYGAFEYLHSFDNGSDFSRAITNEASKYYGATGRAWLVWLAERAPALKKLVRDRADLIARRIVPQLAGGQVQRVGARFSLIAAAGELATEAGLTGWATGESTDAAATCFNAWMNARGGMGNSEVASMLRQVSRFLELHGEGRFTWWHRAADDRAAKTLNRAGVRRMLDDQGTPVKTNSSHLAQYGETMPPLAGEGVSVDFFILAETFKNEVCQGFDPMSVCRVLAERGCLVFSEPGRYSVKQRLPGIGPARCYHINSSIFEAVE